MKSYEVKFWTIKPNRRTDPITGKKRVVSHTVRWTVAGGQKSKTYKNKAQAESSLSDLRQAAKNGEAFDLDTGIPESMLAPDEARSWFEFAKIYVRAYWPDAAANTRDALTDALATVTPALVTDGSDRTGGTPDVQTLRAALRTVAFLPEDRQGEETPQIAAALRWLDRYSLPMPEVVKPQTVQVALSALGQKMDETAAATTTYRRKRAVFFNALQYAVDLGEISDNPLTQIRAKRRKGRTKTVKRVDRRVLMNPRQAQELLTAVSYVGRTRGPHLRALFACMYYGALRLEEVIGLRGQDCHLPMHGWGWLTLAKTRPEAGKQWTDSGERHDDRGLKHRDADEVRPVPIPPALVAMLRSHLDEYKLADDGRLFRTATGGMFSYSAINRVLRIARTYAFPPDRQASMLVNNPYALRHAAVSTWLNGGVSPPDVAERAGHSVNMLLQVYAGCLDGDTDRMNKRIDAVLNEGDE